jgi:uncharacterized protein
LPKTAKIYSLIFIPPLTQYLVTLEEIDGSRLVPIWIGISEGNSIAMVLQGDKFNRPLTHDLTVNILKELGVEIEKIIISDLNQNTYYAIIALRQGDKILNIDSRPSDAIALAVRTNSPIFIDDKVLSLCPVINKPISEEEIRNFEREMESLRPEDFFKKLNEAPPFNEKVRGEEGGP